MAEEIKPQLDIEKELLQRMREVSATSLSLNDVRAYLNAAFSTLVSKILALAGLVTIVAFILGSVFGQTLPPEISNPALILLGIVFVVLLAYVVFKANLSLLRLTKQLAKSNAVLTLSERRASAMVEALAQEEASHKSLFDSCTALFGLALDLCHINVVIARDGSAEFITKLVINAARPGVKSIERYSIVFSNTFSDQLEVDLPQKEIVLKEDNKLILISPLIISKKEGEIEWQLTAEPDFPRNVPVPYEYVTKMPKGTFSMTMNELESSGNRFEWFHQRVTYPTKHLKMEILFPENYKPHNIDADVWNTERSKLRNVGEHKRIIDSGEAWEINKNDGSIKLILDLFYPITGVNYAIRWLPERV